MESHPAECLDFELAFGGYGMAVALPGEGKSFHGVLHKITETEMKALDEIERGYKRTSAKCKLIDGTILDSTLYSTHKTPEEIEQLRNN